MRFLLRLDFFVDAAELVLDQYVGTKSRACFQRQARACFQRRFRRAPARENPHPSTPPASPPARCRSALLDRREGRRITFSLFFGRQVADPQLAELRLEQLIQQFAGRHRVRRHLV
jgi:hypothetical protein